jgi:hypothetical protein
MYGDWHGDSKHRPKQKLSHRIPPFAGALGGTLSQLTNNRPGGCRSRDESREYIKR